MSDADVYYTERHEDEMAAAEERAGSIYARLVSEFLTAFHRDPQCLVETGGKDETVAASIFYDLDEKSIVPLLRFVSRLAKSGDIEALDWIANQAGRHAHDHCDDVAVKRQECD